MDNYSTTPNPFRFLTGPIIGFWLIIAIVSIAGAWKVYTKAGKPGWACIIPFYNLIVLLEIVGKPIWWFLLMLIPCVNFVFIIWVYNRLSKSFGQSEGFTVGLVLLNPIFICILGFGDYTYLGPGGMPPNFGAGDYEKPYDINP
jgi:hypothetical protein